MGSWLIAIDANNDPVKCLIKCLELSPFYSSETENRCTMAPLPYLLGEQELAR